MSFNTQRSDGRNVHRANIASHGDANRHRHPPRPDHPSPSDNNSTYRVEALSIADNQVSRRDQQHEQQTPERRSEDDFDMMGMSPSPRSEHNSARDLIEDVSDVYQPAAAGPELIEISRQDYENRARHHPRTGTTREGHLSPTLELARNQFLQHYPDLINLDDVWHAYDSDTHAFDMTRGYMCTWVRHAWNVVFGEQPMRPTNELLWAMLDEARLERARFPGYEQSCLETSTYSLWDACHGEHDDRGSYAENVRRMRTS